VVVVPLADDEADVEVESDEHAAAIVSKAATSVVKTSELRRTRLKAPPLVRWRFGHQPQ
jgi:hypothetical protein